MSSNIDEQRMKHGWEIRVQTSFGMFASKVASLSAANLQAQNIDEASKTSLSAHGSRDGAIFGHEPTLTFNVFRAL